MLFRDDFFNPASLFQNPDWHDTLVPACEDPDGNVYPELTVRLLDRQIIGQDRLHTTHERAPYSPPRAVFYGLKGGVGRSTALAMLAYSLARAGKKVLLLDFDLESPGLSGLLLPADRVAGFGLVDWFIEDGVHHGESVLTDLVADSPLAENTSGRIRVAGSSDKGNPPTWRAGARLCGTCRHRRGQSALRSGCSGWCRHWKCASDPTSS